MISVLNRTGTTWEGTPPGAMCNVNPDNPMVAQYLRLGKLVPADGTKLVTESGPPVAELQGQIHDMQREILQRDLVIGQLRSNIAEHEKTITGLNDTVSNLHKVAASVPTQTIQSTRSGGRNRK